MSVKSTIEGIFKKDFREIQTKPKAEASAALLKLKAKIQKLEIYSRIFTGKVEKIGSNPRGAALRKIQQETGSAELQEILTGNDPTKINDLAGRILRKEVDLGDRIKTIGLEATLQQTIDLFNQAAAALDRLIANPADAEAREALKDADRQLQILLHPDQAPEIRYALSQEPPKPAQPGFLSRLSGTASSVVTNVTQRLKTLELRRIARDYGVPLAMAAASHATEHPEMFATYAGLTLLTNLVGSCRRQPQRPLPVKQNPLPPATTTTVVAQPLAPPPVQLEQSGQPSAAPSPAHSDQAGHEIVDAGQPQDKTPPPAPATNPEPEALALTQLPATEQQAAPAPSQQLTPPPVSENTEQRTDQQPAEFQHAIKPKMLNRKHKPTAVKFSSAPPQDLPKPQAARKTPSPGVPSVSPTLSPPVAFTGVFQPLASSQKPVPKGVGIPLHLAQQAAFKAQQAKQKAAGSQTQPHALAQSKPKPSAHATALLPAMPLAPYSIVAGTANQNDVPNGKLACTFVSGYMVKMMLEKDAKKQGSVLDQADLDTALISGADSYRSTIERHSKEWEEDLGAAFAEVQLDRPAGFGWSESMIADKELSATLATTSQYTVKNVPLPAINESDGNIQPLSAPAYQAIFKPMLDLADATPGKLIVAAVTFGTGVGIAETFPVGIRKVGNEYEYQFGNSHGTDAFGQGKIQLNRFIPRLNALSAPHRTHFQRYVAQRLAAVSRGQISVEVTVAINELRAQV